MMDLTSHLKSNFPENHLSTCDSEYVNIIRLEFPETKLDFCVHKQSGNVIIKTTPLSQDRDVLRGVACENKLFLAHTPRGPVFASKVDLNDTEPVALNSTITNLRKAMQTLLQTAAA